MMNGWRGGIAAVAALLSGGCTAGIGTQISEPIRPSGAWEVTELVVVPVTTELGSGDAGPVVEAAALAYLSGALPSADLVEPRVARDRLGRAGAGATLAQLLRDYEQSGVADVARVDSVAMALDAERFLQIRVGFAETEVLREELFSEDVSNEDRREVVMVARLWERGESAPAWEGTVRAHSETGFYTTDLPVRDVMLRRVVERLLARLPLVDPALPGAGDGPG
ncbi:MAG TPA: hypothetical protein VLA43_14415 [Longimicrobiales bacterium]|nr:hypothetical protein [Longimicrobiales bacterium]